MRGVVQISAFHFRILKPSFRAHALPIHVHDLSFRLIAAPRKLISVQLQLAYPASSRRSFISARLRCVSCDSMKSCFAHSYSCFHMSQAVYIWANMARVRAFKRSISSWSRCICSRLCSTSTSIFSIAALISFSSDGRSAVKLLLIILNLLRCSLRFCPEPLNRCRRIVFLEN